MGGTVGKIIGGVFGVANADKELGRIRDEKAQAKYDLEDARSKRQEIINPYAGITDLSGLAQDLSSQITNPFNNVTDAPLPCFIVAVCPLLFFIKYCFV